ncbi:hypothetical protein KSP39_PZI000184 [Platanthera zijinensis]|uniref:SWIM-type domain-containing protein n=1 Tax=Platanthera zijinensis TaxID=2320716 RepID=A0AAP0GGQ6_9ASPA
MGQDHSHGLLLEYSDDHKLDLAQGHAHERDQIDEEDNESCNQIHGVHNADPLTFHQGHELVLSDNHELAPNLDDGSHELVLHQSAHLMMTPILQSRVIVNPNHEIHVGQEFPDVKSCRRALRSAAIACHFEIQTVKSDKSRFTARCRAEGCPWRIHAAKLPGVPAFTIRTINGSHNCFGISHLGHQQASVQWVANSVEDRLRQNPHCKPKEILEEIHRVHGITLSYKQAWRGKERIMSSVRGSFEEGYRLLPQYCDQIKRANPGSMASVYGAAAQALTVVEFDAKILEIEDASREAACWIRGIPPRLWATAYFEGTRLGHLTANIAESLSSWLIEASGLPINQMMECIRRQLMTWFNERRETSMRWSTVLVPSAEQRVSEAVERARGYQVGRANEAEFEVVSPHEGSFIVDIRNRCCLCRAWQLYGLPCAHGVSALVFCRQNVHRYTESCFTVATYRKTYSETIHPIPDRSLWKELSEGNHGELDVVINPPKFLRPDGRTRKKRARTEDRGRLKRVVHCSRCNQTGHFRTTCGAPI